MKVINTWGGEPAQTPTQIMRQWYDEYWRDIYEWGIDGSQSSALMTALAPLFAAGPWRTDVENAPNDEYVLLLFEGNGWNIGRAGNKCWISTGEIVFRDNAIAFATINLPEIEG